MKIITNDFKEQISKLGREIDFKFFLHTNDKIITENGNFLITQSNQHLIVEQFDDEEVDEIINANEINNVSIINCGKLLSTMMKEIDFEIKRDLRIGDVIGCQFGLKVNGEYEYVDYGNYMVYSKEYNEDTKSYSYVAFDRMLLTMKEVTDTTIFENRSVLIAIQNICSISGLELYTDGKLSDKYPNLNNIINEGTFTDLKLTYRDVLDMICQVLGVSMIVENKYLKLKGNKIEEVTVSGNNSLYLENAVQGDALSYSMDGATEQDEEPTPNNPQEIKTIPSNSNYIKINIANKDKTKEKKVLIDLSEYELCKIGDYKDNLFIDASGNCRITKNIGKRIVNGSETFQISKSKTNSTYFQMDNIVFSPTSSSTIPNAKSSHFLANTGDVLYNNDIEGFTFNTSGYLRINVSNSIASTINNLKTWLSTNPIEIYYLLTTPETITLSNTKIPLFEGINYVTFDDGLETNTSIVYKAKNEIVDEIDERFLKETNVSFGKHYGPINSIVLSRSEDNDNIYRKDDESIEKNGLCEFKIKDNPILLNDDRENYIEEIFEQLNGLDYYINDFSSTGITYLDWLDFYNVKVGDNTYKCLMLNDEIKISQGLEESIYTEEPEETVTDYKTSSKTDKEVSFIVDKQNGEIKSRVTKNELESTIEQTASSIGLSVQQFKNGEKVSSATILTQINNDDSEVQIDADKISLAGKTIEMTSENIAINSTNFKVDKDGNMTANSGTFGGSINTAQNCTVGDDLYVGQNQSTSYSYTKSIIFSNNSKISKLKIGNTEAISLYSPFLNLNGTEGTNIHYQYNNTQYTNGIFNRERFELSCLEHNVYIIGDQNGIYLSHQPSWPSDKRLKQEIKDIDTSWIDELKVKEFEYIKSPSKKQIGLIAQDYIDKDYSKYFLNENEEGYYGISYGNITNALIQYCQEMKKEINSLKEEIKKLKEDK